MSAPQTFSHYPALPVPVRVPLVTIPDHPCVYLPDRMTRTRAFMAGRVPPETYHALMDAGFRRSGRLMYQPVCSGCRQCVPLRVPVDRFRPGKSQRRCQRRNTSLRVTVGPPVPTDEKHALYVRYLAEWHGRDPTEVADEGSREGFELFLYDSPVDTIEFVYRDGVTGRLLAVGICDVCPLSLSSVYFYFDPAEARRGLGTYGALREIAFAREHRIAHYYLGYWVEGCATMQYKCDFRPAELLGTDGVWRETSAR